jgi:hypothetical protein
LRPDGGNHFLLGWYGLGHTLQIWPVAQGGKRCNSAADHVMRRKKAAL